MEYNKITEFVEKFKNVKTCSDAADVLDEIYNRNIEYMNEVECIRIVHSFLAGLCVGEGLNPSEDFKWFTCFHETIFTMFLDRHSYYLNGNKLIKK